ncbi:MAG: hypothetical protein AAFV88_14070 [Planctomycetota bacterium]
MTVELAIWIAIALCIFVLEFALPSIDDVSPIYRLQLAWLRLTFACMIGLLLFTFFIL